MRLFHEALIRPGTGHLLPADWEKGFYGALRCSVALRFLCPNKARATEKLASPHASVLRASWLRGLTPTTKEIAESTSARRPPLAQLRSCCLPRSPSRLYLP